VRAALCRAALRDDHLPRRSRDRQRDKRSRGGPQPLRAVHRLIWRPAGSVAGSPPSNTLVASLLVDYVDQRLTFPEALIVLQEEAHGVIQPGCRMVGAMGREQHVVEPVEWVAFRQGFGIVHVESRAPNALLR